MYLRFIDPLQKHILSAENFKRNEKYEIQSSFTPIESDDLFWCLFICKYGKEEYLFIPDNRKKNREMDEKNIIIDKIRAIVDKKKLDKKGNNEIEQAISILSTTKTHPIIVDIICQCYQLNVIILDTEKNTYICPSCSFENSRVHIICLKSKKYSIDLTSSFHKLNEIRESCVGTMMNRFL
jgi:hypothetical protein